MDLEKYKRKVKRTYKWYTKERTDGTATILDVISLFHIYLEDEKRYIIQNIDFDKLQIVVLDKKNNTLYKSCYLDDDMFDITIRKEDIMLNYQYHFYINEKTNEQIAITQDEYAVSIKKQNDKTSKKVILTYSKELESSTENKKVEQPLLTKIYQVNTLGEEKEHVFTYCFDAYEKEGNNCDKYCYLLNDNIIYGINDVQKDNGKIKYNGICLKKSLKDQETFDKYRCCEIKPSDSMFDENVKGAMIFKGSVYPNQYELEILVKKDKYFVNLKRINNDIFNKKEIALKQYKISRSKQLITELKKIDSEFINAIMDDLVAFLTKIKNEKKGNMSLIDPKIYLNMNIEQINKLYQTNKEEYFTLVDDQYLEITNLEKIKQKTYKKGV